MSNYLRNAETLDLPPDGTCVRFKRKQSSPRAAADRAPAVSYVSQNQCVYMLNVFFGGIECAIVNEGYWFYYSVFL